jgi:hypothetical protein
VEAVRQALSVAIRLIQATQGTAQRCYGVMVDIAALLANADETDPRKRNASPRALRREARHILPQEYLLRDLAGLSPDRMLISLMKAMRRYIGDHPEVVPALVGGEVQITEITKDGVSTRMAYRFPDYEQVRHAAAAVGGRIERGDLDVDVGAELCRVDDAVEGSSRQRRDELSRAERKAQRRARAA